MASNGIQFLMWPGRGDLARFVFAHSTSDAETVALINSLTTDKNLAN